MKISELSRCTGVALPTIKYYIRAEILPPGVRRSATQADYGPEHVRRLRLIRTLVEIGDLSLASIARILAVVDDPSISVHEMLGVAHGALAPEATSHDDDGIEQAVQEVMGFIEQLGWRVEASTPAVHQLAHALVTLRGLGWEVTSEVFAPYVDAADRIAEWELDQLPATSDRADLVEGVVIGTVVFETVLVAWRRLAEQRQSEARTAAIRPSGSSPPTSA